MIKIKSFFEELSEQQAILALTLVGFMLAALSNLLQHGWINVDSLLYFESARLITIGEWKQAIAIYNWPLYASLLAIVSKLTGLSIQHSAQVWNVIFFTITTFSLAKVIQLAGGGKLTVAIGAFLLFSSSYISGSALPMLLRDQGFWAFFLLSTALFIHFYRNQSTTNGLAWQVTAVIATLFRIEAITYLLLLPVLFLFERNLSWRNRLTFVFRANTLSVIGLSALATALLISSSLHLKDFGRLQEPLSLLKDIGHVINIKGAAMTELLGDDLEDYGLYSTFVSLLAIFIFKVCKLIGWPILAIFATFRANKKRQKLSLSLNSDAHKILVCVLAISAINPLASIFRSFVLSGRYIVSFGFIAFVFGAFCVTNLLETFKKNKYKLPASKIVLAGIMIVLSLSFLHNFSPRKAGYHHEKEAVDFIKNKHIEVDKVFFTTPKSIYYAGLPYGRGCEGIWDCIEESINDGSALNYDYLLIYVDIDDHFSHKKAFLSEKLVDYALIKEFYGLNKKKVLMFYSKVNKSAEYQ